jgi:diaminopimelate epimerase
MEIPFWKITPGGNPTALLPARDVPLPERPRVAAALMDPLHLGCEQVGFVELAPPESGLPRLDMMGGEFCLNAVRAMAALLARENLLPSLAPGSGVREGEVQASGADAPVRVRVEKWEGTSGRASACLRFPDLPLPSRPRADAPHVRMIRLPGIVHLVLENRPPPRQEEQDAVCGDLRRLFGLEDEEAVGCLWLDSRDPAPSLLPLVWVKKTRSLCRESACGSGSLACALALRRPGGQSVLSIRQPGGGRLDVRFAVSPDGQALAWVDGPVHIAAHGFLDPNPARWA